MKICNAETTPVELAYFTHEAMYFMHPIVYVVAKPYLHVLTSGMV